MRDYAKVSPKMWHGKTMKALRKSQEGLLVGVYLMTSPQSNMLGLFMQPIMYMAYETGMTLEGASKGLKHCIEAGFCSYDEESEFVWVHEMAKYQIADELKASDLRCKGIQKEYEGLPENPFLSAFFDRYADSFHMTTRRPYEAPSKPLRSQEQEQEQEQEQDRGERAIAAQSPPTPSAEKQNKGKTLAAYLESCKASKAKPIPDGHSLRTWAAEAGITTEMLQIAWVQFRERYTESEKGKGKRYKDWPGHFATAIKNNWFKLWFAGDGGMQWSSVGLTHKTVLDARMAQKECEHA